MDRKKFLHSSAATVSGIFLVNMGSSSAAQAFAGAQKPLLTQRTLAHVLSREGSRDRFNSVLQYAIDKPKAFVYEYFSVSPVQKQFIDKLSQKDWDSISSVLASGRNTGSTLNFDFAGATDKGPCQIFSIKAEGSNGNILKQAAIAPVAVAGTNNLSSTSQSISSAENESQYWKISPNNIKGVTGRLSLKNLPRDASWNVAVYRESDNKFLDVVYNTATSINFLVLAAGSYKVTFNNMPILSCPILKGNDTQLKFGVLNVASGGGWAVYHASNSSSLVSSYSPMKLILPPGEYRLNLGGNDFTVNIEEGKTAEY